MDQSLMSSAVLYGKYNSRLFQLDRQS